MLQGLGYVIVFVVTDLQVLQESLKKMKSELNVVQENEKKLTTILREKETLLNSMKTKYKLEEANQAEISGSSKSGKLLMFDSVISLYHSIIM